MEDVPTQHQPEMPEEGEIVLSKCHVDLPRPKRSRTTKIIEKDDPGNPPQKKRRITRKHTTPKSSSTESYQTSSTSSSSDNVLIAANPTKRGRGGKTKADIQKELDDLKLKYNELRRYVQANNL